MTPALALNALRLVIGGNDILTGVDLALEAGEILGLVGRSGSGKSMTALAAMGLTPTRARLSGSVKLDGVELIGKREREMCDIRGREIAMIFQEPMTALNPLQTIGAQVAETLLIHKACDKLAAREEAQRLLARVGLPPDQVSDNRFPHELSGGQRQRVVIAMAIAMKPKVLLADEPTTALDVTTQADILALLRRLAREDDIALLFITHDLAVISEIADRIAVMKDGRIIEEHAPEDFFRDGLSDDANGLVARPVIRATRKMATPDAGPALRSTDVVCSYPNGSRALFSRRAPLRAGDGVSLVLNKGEHLGLVGESGSGKSTFARALLGLHPLDSGAFEIDGEDFPSPDRTASRRIRRHIQIVFQDPYSSFDPRQTVRRIVAEPLYLLDAPTREKEKREKATEALANVGLSPGDGEKYPHEFSGGQRQRIALARALITEPSIVVLDEATSALDVTSRNRVLDLLMRLSEERAVSYLIITHDLTLVRDITHRIAVMKSGRIVEQGPTHDIMTTPQHAYTRALIAAAPKMRWSVSG